MILLFNICVDFFFYNQQEQHVVLLFPNIFFFLVEGLKDVFHQHNEKRFGPFILSKMWEKKSKKLLHVEQIDPVGALVIRPIVRVHERRIHKKYSAGNNLGMN